MVVVLPAYMMQSSPFILGLALNWFLDTSVTYHMTLNLTSLSHVDDYYSQDSLYVGDGNGL